MQYMTIPEAAVQWRIMPKELHSKCDKHEIEGAVPFRRTWLIPSDAPKPKAETVYVMGHQPLWFNC